MKKTFSWDDIPSLDGAEVDWDYKPQAALEKRAFVRLDMGVVSQLVEVKQIAVKLATVKKNYDGALIDISEGGLALSLPVLLDIDLPVKVGLFLGNAKIISRGLVRHAGKNGNRFITGIQFIDLPPESAEYIAGFYAAKVLNRIV
jgi:hypothetical protein